MLPGEFIPKRSADAFRILEQWPRDEFDDGMCNRFGKFLCYLATR